MYLDEIVTRLFNIAKITVVKLITWLNKKLNIHKMEDNYQSLKLKWKMDGKLHSSSEILKNTERYKVVIRNKLINKDYERKNITGRV